jgi:16S rRNA (uracil1498-N3)-methyltransferase
MVPRLYVPSLASGARVLTLPADEGDHLRRVLRAKAGWAVRVFDGRGAEYEARVAAIGRDGVSVEVGDAVAAAAECRVRVTLAQAVLKGEKIDAVIRDAVMMGVAAVQPVLTDRTDVPASAFDHGGRTGRWRRIAIASVKQCGRAVVPEIHPPLSLRACLDAHRCEAGVVLVEPSAAGRAPETGSVPRGPASALVIVGPEGGWEPDEVAKAVRAGCVPMTLGPRTLRADAAPIVALSVLMQYWGELPDPGGRGLRTGD